MTDQNTFMETVKAVAEIVRTAEAPLSETEMLSYFSDMDLSKEQKTLILQYLTNLPDEDEDATIEEDSAESENRPAVLKMYLDELAQLPSYTDEERQNMYERLLAGDDKMISAILELWLSKVTLIAGQYAKEKIPVEDLIQEGNMALFLNLTELCGAGQQEDLEKQLEQVIETGVMEYASAMAGEQELENAMRGKVRLVYEASKILKEEMGREPVLEELSDYTKLSKEELNDIMDIIDKMAGER